MAGTVTFRNEFTINQVAEGFRDLLDAVRGTGEVLVDIRDAEKVDIAAIQLLLAAKKESERAGNRLTFRVSDAAKRFLLSMGIKL